MIMGATSLLRIKSELRRSDDAPGAEGAWFVQCWGVRFVISVGGVVCYYRGAWFVMSRGVVC